MRKLALLFVVLLFLCISAFKSDNLPPLFSGLLNRAQMTFTQPEGLTVILSPVKNGQMNYEYAVKSPDKGFEVRYTVRPLDSLLMKYAEFEKNKAPGSAQISPNKFYPAAFIATMMNITGGHMSKVVPYNTEAVKKEFNADWGATCIGNVTGDFGKGYTYCMAVAIHKDNVGDAYYFYLSDNQDNLKTMLTPVFHALVFKP